ncbi:hypothetical protein DKX38_013070 [Salix brachista]|uniref:RNase H type-1 domain-containing protein n=1 Tax=Salix brachista TaxID=2182728 RepID=A0A5N5LQT2_9ROSI|nr:hypothetical protein DKX38_013070 [Salix brachista]
MENEKDAFFVVRKGDVAGVYKNFADCEAQLGTSILDPPVSVYKGYSLSKDSEAYLVSHGLQNALYTIRAADLKEDIFGMLIPCPFQIFSTTVSEHTSACTLSGGMAMLVLPRTYSMLSPYKLRNILISSNKSPCVKTDEQFMKKFFKVTTQLAECYAWPQIHIYDDQMSVWQQPASPYAETYQNDANKKRPQEILGSEIKGIDETASTINKHTKLDIQAECQAQTSNSVSCNLVFPGLASKHFKILVFVNSWHIETLIFYSQKSCLLEFDGASKGNPGQAGAGAVLRNDDGSLICRLREGLGIATNNMAEYRAVLLGMKHALGKGYTKIHVKGDSKLVCMQLVLALLPIQGSWKARHENITNLYEEAKKLKNSFLSFHISHFPRECNSEADAQANLAVKLASSSVTDGEVQEEFE